MFLRKSTVIKTFLHKNIQNAIMRRHFSSEKYDIIIAGGGMIGTTLACTLGQNPKLAEKRILLLEGSKRKSYKLTDKYSNRVSSLNPGTIKLLSKIGAWEYIKNARYASVKRMQVWDGVSDAVLVFKPDGQDDDIAYIVENDVLLDAVGKILQTISNVQVVYESKISQCHLPEMDQDFTQVELENGEKYTCNLVLGCDGANSQIRKAMNVNYLNWSYNQMGLVATLKLEENINNIAWQRFLTTGPVALLPLSNNLSSLVWSTTPEHSKQLLKMSEEEFVDNLNQAIWSNNKRNSIVDTSTKGLDNILRNFNCSSDVDRQLPPKIIGCEENSRAIFPLGFGHATSYIGKGVALVGDAAHRIHPLAGQGVNLGFGDITCLDNILGEAVYSGSREDNLQYLKDYETQRQRHNIPTMLAIEGLHRLYNTENIPLVLLRSLGLQLTHSMSPLKKFIMAQAAS